MTVMALEREMAAKKQQEANPDAKPRRDDMAVKIERILAEKSKLVATRRGLTMAEYLSDILRKAVERDFSKEVREMEGER